MKIDKMADGVVASFKKLRGDEDRVLLNRGAAEDDCFCAERECPELGKNAICACG